MLRELNIKDFAIIHDLRVQFDESLNILTGETGAGKSIVIGALGLLLGERADMDFIRTGQETASVEGLFDCGNYRDIFSFLDQAGIELNEDQLLLKRVVSRSGRNKIYVNGSLSTLAVLKEIGNRLVDIHGQHQHQLLLHPENHIEVYDSFNKLSAIRDKYKELYVKLLKCQTELNALHKNERENLQKKDLFEFQMKEIDDASLTEAEEDDLKKERVILQNAEKLFQISNQSYEALYSSDNSVIEQLNRVLEELSSVAGYDESIKKIQEEVKPSLFLLEESSNALRDYSRQIEINPEKLAEIEDRLVEINELKRKYGNSLKEILAHRKKIEKEYNAIAYSNETLEKLNKEFAILKKDLAKAAVSLAENRENIVKKFESMMENELRQLSMDGVIFKVNFSYKKDENSFIKYRGMQVSFSENGIGTLEFLISPNQGEEPRPLAKIASGGELSRIMLSLKNLLAAQDTVPIMIFDEVDSGIGGKVAETVGLKLKRISQNKQVFCITHLTQIASLKGAHYRIEKEVVKGRSVTIIRRLSNSERVDEIARMSGGESITQLTREHAKEMLSTHP
ncbi:MAG TPA: DNA repair protein RecN [Nitrospinota bacterium]|nr:DNA repair protein RecN [Nitrospinota bacterium]